MSEAVALPPARITVYATGWCPHCRRAKGLLDRLAVPYRWIDIEKSAQAPAIVMRINGGDRTVPTIVFDPGPTMVAPGSRQLTEALRASGYSIPEKRTLAGRPSSFLGRLMGR